MLDVRRVITWFCDRLRAAFDGIVEDAFKFGISFVVGLGLGAGGTWLATGGASTKSNAVSLPAGYETYVFVSQNFTDAAREIRQESENVGVAFDPSGIDRLRFCGDMNIDSRPRGEEYLELIVERLGSCLTLNKDNSEGITTITVSAVTPASSVPSKEGFVSTYRSLGPGAGTEYLYFCHCEDETVKLLETNTIYP